MFDDHNLNKENREDNVSSNSTMELGKTNTDWSSYSSRNLKTAVSSKLKTNKSCKWFYKMYS